LDSADREAGLDFDAPEDNIDLGIGGREAAEIEMLDERRD